MTHKSHIQNKIHSFIKKSPISQMPKFYVSKKKNHTSQSRQKRSLKVFHFHDECDLNETFPNNVTHKSRMYVQYQNKDEIHIHIISP